MPLIKIHTQKGKAKKVRQAIMDGVDKGVMDFVEKLLAASLRG